MNLAAFKELRAKSGVLRTFLLADACIQLAELCAWVVLPWWITSQAGAAALAMYGSTMAVAMLVAAPLAAPWGDRVCKSQQMRLGLVTKMAIAAAMAVVAVTDAFSLVLLLPLAVVQFVASAVIDQSRANILQELLPPDQLPMAIRLRKTSQSVSGMVGPVLAGFSLGVVGVAGALCVLVTLLGVALFFALQIPTRTAAIAQQGGLRQWWLALQSGVIAKWSMPMERGWTAVNFIVWIFQGPAVGMLIPIKVHALGLSGDWLGYQLGALSFGVLCGSVWGSEVLVHHFGRYTVRLALGVFEGLALTLVGCATSAYWMLIGLALAGFCNASLALVGATHRALAIPQNYRVRIFAASSMSTQIAGAIGPALVGMALARWNINAVYMAFGLLMSTSVLGFLWVPRLREFLTLGHTEVVDWYGHQYPQVFK